MALCTLCPRACGADREMGQLGFCGQGKEIQIARASLHAYEEPCISGVRGSGTVFFVGCTLRCSFCQNRAISRGESKGQTLTPQELSDLFLDLEAQGAHNINLVTATQFTPAVTEALTLAKPRLSIPVVWNSSGYERPDTLRMLDGLVDVYLPDYKYSSPELASRYSAAPNYPAAAREALVEMYRQVGRCVFDGEGMMQRGVLVRHLILPSCRHDSMAALEELSSLLPVSEIRLSLMSQYTPEFAMDSPYKELHRRLTAFEYESVLSRALALGFEGYMQGRSSASAAYTPEF